MNRRTALLATLSVGVAALACTSAIVGPGASLNGKTLLWKHRDTSHLQNFVARVDRPGELPFIALFNAGDSALAEAWVGVNSAGFAVMNTASYNLAPDTAKFVDQEGFIMAQALGRCRTLADFESLLDSLPRPLGVQANFGVIDSTGAGAYYETDDFSYKKYDLRADSMLIRTNFSIGGTCGDGLGRERYAAACHLLADRRDISPITLTDTVSLSYWPRHAAPAPADDRGQYIPRRSTSASVVIEGTTMTVRPRPQIKGTHTYRVTLDSIPADLLPDSTFHAPAWSLN